MRFANTVCRFVEFDPVCSRGDGFVAAEVPRQGLPRDVRAGYIPFPDTPGEFGASADAIPLPVFERVVVAASDPELLRSLIRGPATACAADGLRAQLGALGNDVFPAVRGLQSLFDYRAIRVLGVVTKQPRRDQIRTVLELERHEPLLGLAEHEDGLRSFAPFRHRELDLYHVIVVLARPGRSAGRVGAAREPEDRSTDSALRLTPFVSAIRRKGPRRDGLWIRELERRSAHQRKL